MRVQINSHDYEQLSAYIDDQLAAADRRKLEERLHLQPDLQAALDELTRTRALLRTAPRRRAPRNFTLTPAMVGGTRPRRVNNFFNLFPALSFASALATLALVVSVAFQLLPGAQTSSTLMAAQPQADTAGEVQRELKNQEEAAAAPAPEQPAPESAMPAAKIAESSEGAAPSTITWGDPYAVANGAYGMGGGGGGDGSSNPTGALLGPPCADGRCGGAPDAIYDGRGGGGMGSAGVMGTGGGVIQGPLTLPVPGAEDSTSRSAEESAPQSAQPDPSISGSGPILGVPAGEMEGQIIDQKLIQGQPVTASVEEALPSDPTGQPRLLIIQVLLGIIALITGAAAFLARRSRAG